MNPHLSTPPANRAAGVGICLTIAAMMVRHTPRAEVGGVRSGECEKASLSIWPILPSWDSGL